MKRARQCCWLPARTVPNRSVMSTALRRHQPFGDRVLLRHQGVFAVLGDLQMIEPRGDGREDRGLARADKQGAPGEGGTVFRLAPHACSTAAGPRCARMSSAASAGYSPAASRASSISGAVGSQREGEGGFRRPGERHARGRHGREGGPDQQEPGRDQFAPQQQGDPLQQQQQHRPEPEGGQAQQVQQQAAEGDEGGWQRGGAVERPEIDPGHGIDRAQRRLAGNAKRHADDEQAEDAA